MKKEISEEDKKIIDGLQDSIARRPEIKPLCRGCKHIRHIDGDRHSVCLYPWKSKITVKVNTGAMKKGFAFWPHNFHIKAVTHCTGREEKSHD